MVIFNKFLRMYDIVDRPIPLKDCVPNALRTLKADLERTLFEEVKEGIADTCEDCEDCDGTCLEEAMKVILEEEFTVDGSASAVSLKAAEDSVPILTVSVSTLDPGASPSAEVKSAFQTLPQDRPPPTQKSFEFETPTQA